MSRGGIPSPNNQERFPRVSGDEPLQAAQKASQARFSPRERG